MLPQELILRGEIQEHRYLYNRIEHVSIAPIAGIYNMITLESKIPFSTLFPNPQLTSVYRFCFTLGTFYRDAARYYPPDINLEVMGSGIHSFFEVLTLKVEKLPGEL